ncbi:cytidylyltransferase domain-containing protein [Clostridium formicaceticum]|uniref:3-deoxy-manno-octulosonate cytidylyltransferase n=1 Tax=Clostridium formicaceticum TaxID=1497 RepID=A0AAC9WFM3_9CLOT|nr:glycosyltransferase family protein [Clostridium formicaceticum]AOY78277.1 acylneuraminate cytidylyltransferase [Clostridium formicaceticum]ARE85980.1 3-deoxy-manno-octulosonate cytidylyltransferase [Clostridium formicaceticum]
MKEVFEIKKVVAIIQARMGSTRLQGKVLKDLCGKTVLAHDIERVKQSKLVNEIVIATTISKEDDAIVAESLNNGTKFYRGSEEDVLGRYYKAALENEADVVVRITSDCPLIDPYIADEIINYYLENNYDLVTNAGSDLGQRTYPRGLDVEVFSFCILKEAHEKAKQLYQREHVTPYIYENSEKIYYYKNEVDYSRYRWTLDTEEDFQLITEIYKELYEGRHDFYLDDVIKLFNRRPELYDINKHISQKKV